MRQMEIDDQSYELAQKLASRSGTTMAEAVAAAHRRSFQEPVDPGAIIGSMSDQAELLDQIVEEAMREREARPLRLPNG